MVFRKHTCSLDACVIKGSLGSHLSLKLDAKQAEFFASLRQSFSSGTKTLRRASCHHARYLEIDRTEQYVFLLMMIFLIPFFVVVVRDLYLSFLNYMYIFYFHLCRSHFISTLSLKPQQTCALLFSLFSFDSTVKHWFEVRLSVWH